MDDARIPRDNNTAERRLRGPAVGRKNYYGSPAEGSGPLAMLLFSRFAPLQLWQLHPRTWLRWYLEACAAAGGQAPTDRQPFWPWNQSAAQRDALAQPLSAEDVPDFLNSS